ncbi:ral guanine nucleotide dissociation stimulator-like [Perognathus longimembris pacificus]|uniref:ral guanine nucleotide dissociation stimulator-like n=1 Tax=Perognathus longimembris pacificus TaxID=214514 RepID=UPI002018CF08|nr:ral guanine nucleotide dissociation stimulator-like [Perognathus longimembris pacificus]
MLADNASAQEWAPEALAPTPSMEAILPSQSYLELSTASEPPSGPGHAVELQHEPLGDGYSGSPAPSLMEPSAGQSMTHSLSPSPAPSLELKLQDSAPLSDLGGVTCSSVPGSPSPVAPTTSAPGIQAAGHAGGETMSVFPPEFQPPQGKAEPIATCTPALEACAVQPVVPQAITSYNTGPELEDPGHAEGEAMSVSTPKYQPPQGKAEPIATCAPALEACAVQPEAPQAIASYNTGPELEDPGDGRLDSALGPCVEQEESCSLAGEAAWLPPPDEEPEPSAREPLPTTLDVAAVPTAHLDMDATDSGGDSDAAGAMDAQHDLPVADETHPALLCAAEPEPAPPPAREADMPAEVEPAPREFLDLEDFQVSSREPSQISMKDFENDLTRAHVLEWLPELKAEQFSLMAVELFKKLKPYHCLHYVRADPNDERQERLAPTVLAILTHCDQVASCVITTCLGDHSAQAAERAEVVEHWIEVALQCHLLRNVCSLFAVLSALQSSPLQGLKRTWRAVSRDSLAVFKELKRMFSKETIYKGRPSKYMAIWKKLRRGQRKPKELDYPEGTVPHLGTILTHLASLQKDKDSKNGTWISMKQRREEFKVMSLIKELQGTCQELHVVPEVNFVSWFTNLKRLSESECAKLSMELEPPVRACCLDRNPRWSPLMRKPSRHLQAPTRQLSRDGSSQVKTSDRLRSGTSSAPPTVQLGYSPRPYCHCYRLYQSAPNIYRSKILQEYDGILPLLSPQTFRRVGQEEIT